MEKIIQKNVPKNSPDSSIQGTQLKIRCFERQFNKKPLKSYLDFFLCTQFLFMDQIMKNRRGWELVTNL